MRKWFNSTEEVVSMLLGLIIVVVVTGLIVNFFRKQQGNIDVPGISNTIVSNDTKLEPTGTTEKEKSNSDQSQKTIYEVKKGDSLWKIAESNLGSGYEWTKIAKENNLKNPGFLYQGQKLNLTVVKVTALNQEKTSDAAVTVITGDNYMVVKGDNLWKISVRAYGDGYKWTTIWQANKGKISDSNKLFVGTNLVIPRDGKGP